MLILITVMYLGTLFLCIYALKQWQKYLVLWITVDAECQGLKDRVNELEDRYDDFENEGPSIYDLVKGEEAPYLIPFDLLDERAEVPWEEIRGCREAAPNLVDSGPPHNLH